MGDLSCSFETNVVMADYAPLIEKVLAVFAPGKYAAWIIDAEEHVREESGIHMGDGVVLGCSSPIATPSNSFHNGKQNTVKSGGTKNLAKRVGEAQLGVTLPIALRAQLANS